MIERDSPYDRPFWFSYAANFTLQAMVAFLFRYSDFVRVNGGDEFDLGLIVGVGMIGSLSMRAAQGIAIDRIGPRKIWLGSVVLILIGLLGHLTVHSARDFPVYLFRIFYMTGLAGAYGASITFTFQRVKPQQMAEAVGTLGTSGFLGLILGSYGSDWLCPGPDVSRSEILHIFYAAIGLMIVSFVVAWCATAGAVPPPIRRRPPMWSVIRRYHPGSLMLMSGVMGFGIALPYNFLRPYQAELGINGLGLFFTVYAITAFVSRLTVRGWPEKYGNRPMIMAGMLFLILSIFLYLPVRENWQLVFPGLASGVSHAVLFPAIVAGGSSAFPNRYRGLGTSLMLAMFDVGTLIGAPSVGGLLKLAKLLNWPPFPSMFVFVATVLIVATGYFAFLGKRDKP